MPKDLDTIEKLIKFMEEHGLSELSVKQGDLEFRARRGPSPAAYSFAPAHPIVHGVPMDAASSGLQPAAVESGKAPAAAGGKPEGNFKEICSPIVGTFYRKPNPNAPPYVELGDRVEKDTVVCIVEAMKVMNEIKADVKGTIKKLLVEDATPVEFGQPLFLVEPG